MTPVVAMHKEPDNAADPGICYCDDCLIGRRLALLAMIELEAQRRRSRVRDWAPVLEGLLSDDPRENELAMSLVARVVKDPGALSRWLHRVVGTSGSV